MSGVDAFVLHQLLSRVSHLAHKFKNQNYLNVFSSAQRKKA